MDNYSRAPWHYKPRKNKSAFNIYSGYGENQECIGMIEGTLNQEPEIKEANARLMAAAPDLEHAVRSLLTALDGEDPHNYLWMVAIPRAKDALNKAGVK